MNMRSLGIFVALLLFFGSVALAADAPAPKPLDVRDIMSVSQFHQTGLDKLSPDELQALNAWLNSYIRGAAPAAQAAATPVSVPVSAPAATTGVAAFGKEMLPEKDNSGPDVMKTRILGDFEGWSGGTVFKLENGQVWVQAAPGSFDTHLENPEVVIKKMYVGYMLTLPGHGGTVFVRRLQ
jgi:hypothetical protein